MYYSQLFKDVYIKRNCSINGSLHWASSPFCCYWDQLASHRFNSTLHSRLQNSPNFCVFKYARAVKQKVWNEAENRERDWFFFSRLTRPSDVWGSRARKTLTPPFTDFFTDFEKKTDCFAVYSTTYPFLLIRTTRNYFHTWNNIPPS